LLIGIKLWQQSPRAILGDPAKSFPTLYMDVQNHLSTKVITLLFAPFSASAVKNMLTVPSTYFCITLVILVV
jgi:hypothetical protein